MHSVPFYFLRVVLWVFEIVQLPLLCSAMWHLKHADHCDVTALGTRTWIGV
eukprot:COSAG01_NODE_8411_length_2794_cov_3.991095_3_plen_51_part_00